MYMHEAGGPGHIPLLFFMYELGHSKGHHSHRFHWIHLCLPTLIPQAQVWSTRCYPSNPIQFGLMIWFLHIIYIVLDSFLDATWWFYTVKYALFENAIIIISFGIFTQNFSQNN